MSTPRSAWRSEKRVGEVDEITERELNVDSLPPQPPRIAHQNAHLVAALEQLRDKRLAHRPARAGQQHHPRALVECALR